MGHDSDGLNPAKRGRAALMGGPVRMKGSMVLLEQQQFVLWSCIQQQRLN